MNDPEVKNCPGAEYTGQISCPGGRAADIKDAPPAPINASDKGDQMEDITEFRFR